MPKFLIIFLIAVFGVTACGTMNSRQVISHDLQATTLKIVQQQSRRLYKLNKIEPTQRLQSEQQEIKQLSSRLAKFEQYIIAASSKLEQQQEWYAAERVYLQALQCMPQSDLLRTVVQQFSERRAFNEMIVRTELAMHQGEQLLKDADAYQRLQQVKGRSLLTWLELNRYQGLRIKSAKALQGYMQDAMQRQDYYLAHRGLTIAQHLYGDEKNSVIEQNLIIANRHLQKTNRQLAKRTGKKYQHARLVSHFQNALQAGNLMSAQRNFQQLQRQYPHYEKLLLFQVQLQAKLNVQVSIAIEQGKDLYSEGKVDQALDVWRQAKKLDPRNVELLASIARGERVLANLHNLSAQSNNF